MTKNMNYISERDRYMHRPVTLDGRKAWISGRLENFATVWQTDDMRHQVEFCWEAVRHVCDEHNGEFRS